MRIVRRCLLALAVLVPVVSLPVPAGAITYTRHAGADRYDTASRVARSAFPNGAAKVYVATGEGFADALAGTAVAIADGAPIVLVARDSIPGPTDFAIRRLAPSEIVVLGGPFAVSDGVVDRLRGYAPVTVVAGEDRFATAAELSKRKSGAGVVVHVAAGDTFHDALTAGVGAGFGGGPELLVAPDHVPGATRDELQRLQPTEVVVVGKVTQSQAVLDQLAQATSAPITKVGGTEPYATSATMARRLFPGTAAGLVVATGRDYPDALTGGVLAGVRGWPLLITPTDAPPASVLDAAWKLEPPTMVTVGGLLAVSDETEFLFVQWAALGPNPGRNPVHGDGPESPDRTWKLLYANNPTDGSTVRFNPCREIGWVFNPTDAPENALADATAAMGRIAEATGMTLRYEGTTDEPPSIGRKAYQPQRYGQRWAPILVAWTPRAGFSQAPGPYGVGVPLLAGPEQQRVIVSGVMLINSEPASPIKPGYLNLLLHEIGHVFGLDHPHDLHQVMQAPSLQPNGMLQEGDRAGLAAVGKPAGCLTDPRPA